MEAPSYATAVWSVGLGNAKSAHHSVPVRLRFVQRAPHSKRSLTSGISVLCCSISESGHPLPNATLPTVLYNDNNACVKWPYNMTSKAARHIESRENLVQELVQDKSIKVVHVAG